MPTYDRWKGGSCSHLLRTNQGFGVLLHATPHLHGRSCNAAALTTDTECNTTTRRVQKLKDESTSRPAQKGCNVKQMHNVKHMPRDTDHAV